MTNKDDIIEQPDVKTGFDDLLEDLFGLNIRSVRSLKALFVKPSEYFKAAKTKDWGGQQFTPSPRLWIGLIAITVATRFLWGDTDGAFMQVMSEQAQAGFEIGLRDNPDVDASNIDWTESIQKMFDISMLIQPFMMVAVMMLLATMVRFWGEPLTYVVRLRYLFAIIIPASVVNLIATIMIFMVPTRFMTAVSISQLVIMIVLYTLTSLLGPFKGQARDSAIPKAVVLTIILFVAVMIANMIAQTIAMGIVLIPDIAKATIEAKAAG